uniref:Uncharacterized protein n=1 Tax=Vitis vinifera TaxID=29760 RepID=A5ACW1_VITVI|nr:hypothetical protein VITISV_009644 [Vitis vinifera]
MQGPVARIMARAVARVTCLGSTRGHHPRPSGIHLVSMLASWEPCKAPWHASWHRRWHASRVLARLIGTKQGPVARIVCLGSARGHHARSCGTCHSMGDGMRHMSWLDWWEPCKAPWHASWHEWWHASRVLAWLMGTMQGPVARIMARAVARIQCLGSTHKHQARPHGTRRISWLGSRAPSKALWHVSHVLAWLAGIMQGPVAHIMPQAVAHVTCLNSAHQSPLARVMARVVARITSSPDLINASTFYQRNGQSLRRPFI